MKYTNFEEGQTCGNCNGKGRVYLMEGEDGPSGWDICLDCDGTGQVWSSEYEKDKATGRL